MSSINCARIVPWHDKAPAGTLCQQMNFLIRLSLGLAIQARASETVGNRPELAPGLGASDPLFRLSEGDPYH